MKHFIESYARIDEQAHVTGVALYATISRNNNLYTKEELKRFNNIKVPMNWEHDPSKVIGEATFFYNPELEIVYYEGLITDESVANLAKNRTLYVSIEADPQEMKEVCNAPGECFNMPYLLRPRALGVTETPGVSLTSLEVIESYIKRIKECEHDEHLENKYAPEQTNLKHEQHIRNLLEGDAEPDNDCISSKVSKLDSEHPDWSSDKKVAVAISQCSEKEMKEYVLENVFKINEFCTCGDLKKKNR